MELKLSASKILILDMPVYYVFPGGGCGLR